MRNFKKKKNKSFDTSINTLILYNKVQGSYSSYNKVQNIGKIIGNISEATINTKI